MGVSAMFEQDRTLVKELLWLLSREQTSLINADIDAMEVLLDEKAQLLQAISASVQIRHNALAKLGFEPNENGMSAWVAKNATPEQVDAWREFQQVLTQAKEMNRLNGQLINKHFTRNHQFLQQLQGGQTTGVYGANGQTAASNPVSRAALSV